jgi:FkbM family methyltransferase
MYRNNIIRQISLLRSFASTMMVFDKLRKHSGSTFHVFGFGFFSQLIGHFMFNPDNQASVYLYPPRGGNLTFYLNDLYWTPLLIPGNVYEPEVQAVLSHNLTLGTFFIDCGANIGYWSVFARKYLPPENILAIEAYQPTFDQLLHNAAQNGNFPCLFAALSDKDGEEVWIGGNQPASMSLAVQSPGEKRLGSWVETVTLNTVYRTHVPTGITRLVIKLDIEGMETRVLGDSREVLECHPLIIYEDHGKDKTCETSKYIHEVLGYCIYHWDSKRGIYPVDLDDITRIKRSKRIGYNFFACHPQSTFWFH